MCYYIKLWWPISAILVEGVMRYNSEFGRVGQEKMTFEDISIFSSGSYFVKQSGTICAIIGKHTF